MNTPRASRPPDRSIERSDAEAPARAAEKSVDSVEEPAGLLRRTGAIVYDALLVLALWMATLFPLVAITNHAVFGAVVQTLLFLELYLFYVCFWLFRGQTLGMLAWKLEIRTDDGTPMSLTRVSLRIFAGIVPLVIALFLTRVASREAGYAGFGLALLGHLWMLIDPARRTLTDLCSGTRMVFVRATRTEP